MKNSPKVSIVIPAYNEEKWIEQTLFSLLESEQKTHIDYEVILVDNNCTDQTVRLAQKFSKGMDLKIIHERIQTRGAARARGFKEAKGEIILSADADTILYRGWIESLVAGIKGKVVAVTTSCKIEDCSLFTNALFNLIQPMLMFSYRIVVGHYWLSGFSFGILKSVYEQAGGFDTNLQVQEDIELSFRVARLGKIKLISKPVILSGRRYKDGLLVGLFEYAKTFTEAVIFKKKNPYLDNPR